MLEQEIEKSSYYKQVGQIREGERISNCIYNGGKHEHMRKLPITNQTFIWSQKRMRCAYAWTSSPVTPVSVPPNRGSNWGREPACLCARKRRVPRHRILIQLHAVSLSLFIPVRHLTLLSENYRLLPQRLLSSPFRGAFLLRLDPWQPLLEPDAQAHWQSPLGRRSWWQVGGRINWAMYCCIELCYPLIWQRRRLILTVVFLFLLLDFGWCGCRFGLCGLGAIRLCSGRWGWWLCRWLSMARATEGGDDGNGGYDPSDEEGEG